MANHAYVKTRRKMTAETITALITRLNETIFKGCVKVTYHKSKNGDKQAWGEHVWEITLEYKGKKYLENQGRVCWLNTAHSFEIRHGGGNNIFWWIDHAICNEVALQFNGTWTDDGDDTPQKGVPGRYRRYRSFARNMQANFWARKVKNPSYPWNTKERIGMMWSEMQGEEKFLPPPFRLNNWRFLVSMKINRTDAMSATLTFDTNPKYAKDQL